MRVMDYLRIAATQCPSTCKLLFYSAVLVATLSGFRWHQPQSSRQVTLPFGGSRREEDTCLEISSCVSYVPRMEQH
jgi:hypothetical protein